MCDFKKQRPNEETLFIDNINFVIQNVPDFPVPK